MGIKNNPSRDYKDKNNLTLLYEFSQVDATNYQQGHFKISVNVLASAAHIQNNS